MCRHHRHVAPTPKIKTQHQSEQQIIGASNGYVQEALFIDIASFITKVVYCIYLAIYMDYRTDKFTVFTWQFIWIIGQVLF